MNHAPHLTHTPTPPTLAPPPHTTAVRPSPVPTPTGPPGGDPAAEPGGGLVLLFLLGAAVWAIGYRISVRLHPFKACRLCEGTGKRRGAWFTHAYRACDRCGGTGREHRAFATDPYKQNPHRRRRQE